MARVKKISAKQFVLDCINKEFEVIGCDIHWDTFEELSDWTKLEENWEWFVHHSFTSEDQYDEWKSYFLKHFYDWQPKRIPKWQAEREFAWFALNYGFIYDFSYKTV
jgi:hypothetical protein